MKYKVFTTAKGEELKKRRRRIGEFTKEIINFKNSLGTWNNIQTECKLLQA